MHKISWLMSRLPSFTSVTLNLFFIFLMKVMRRKRNYYEVAETEFYFSNTINTKITCKYCIFIMLCGLAYVVSFGGLAWWSGNCKTCSPFNTATFDTCDTRIGLLTVSRLFEKTEFSICIVSIFWKDPHSTVEWKALEYKELVRIANDITMKR